MGAGQKTTLKKTSTEKEELPIGTENIYAEEQLGEGIQLFNDGKYIEAIEIFTLHSSIGNLLARQYLARCYHRLELYDVAYKHFQYLAEKASGKYREYGISMVAAIEIVWGNFGQAIKLLKSLPPEPRNLINLSLLYWKKYKVQKDELSLRDALKILNKLDVFSLHTDSAKNVYHLKALIYQTQKDYRLAESNYVQALKLSENDISRGQALNDFASLYIEIKKYEEAEKLLFEARKLVQEKSILEEAYNNKWFGILAIKRKEYEIAKEYLMKAVKVIREKELVREVAGIVFLLAELSKNEGFYKAADHYAEGIALEKLLEEVKGSDEKIVAFYFDSYFGNSNNTSNSS